MILYLHGFRSSPLSMKARLTGQRMAQLGRSAEFICPQLPASPKLAMELAMGLVAHVPPSGLTIIGSSLGGYYATWMAEKLKCRAVVLNPAVVAALDLEKHVGVTTAYHSDELFEFKREYIDELLALSPGHMLEMERYFLIACTGDEVLDYRQMLVHYRGAKRKVVEGSDHAISEYADYLDEVLEFCGITGGTR
ncbi:MULTISPECIES: YqiA/YcfP family alpha/beta fold hydrolase [unclassified Duganella]|uniref:YqiA/YcfP family alpha/beta fold hydrolase n=1 Tax=unclassified Duganella TaxID=2636909 RepID=UPI0006F97F1D|nr:MULTISPECIES: YqiA/YcfP family alpha/beta fold hydrolase [unclassified Duganella]KQV53765.1 esterase [Duganella sp. Root336D2]KRB83679.1 esterase [Duganella sp. Root198D2]